MRGSRSDLCSSVPNLISVGAIVLSVRNGTGTPATAASSVKMSWSSIGRFCPPYSSGQPIASQPSRPIWRTMSLYASPSPYSPPVSSPARRSGVISDAK
jgi:hypothetical protein